VQAVLIARQARVVVVVVDVERLVVVDVERLVVVDVERLVVVEVVGRR
jgi:hypothetical protein